MQEPSVSYNYGQNKINKYHDKTFKNLFSNKKETVIFINKYLKLKNTKNELSSNQIEKCPTEFITWQKEQLETDILYRIKGTKIFILIEQQSKVDHFMSKRILYYYVEIMKEIEKEILLTTKDTLPIIYPIVLYTGKAKWTAKKEIGSKKAQKLRKKIDKEVKENMVTENLRNIFRMNYNEGVEMGIQSGIQTATRNFIIQMLKNNMSEKTIKKLTKIKDSELQKIKNEANLFSK